MPGIFDTVVDPGVQALLRRESALLVQLRETLEREQADERRRVDDLLATLAPGLLVTWNGRCFDLPFADRVGFRSNPAGDFDRFSSVFVRGQRCAVKSVTASAPPPKPVKKAEHAKTGAAPDVKAPEPK